MPVINKSTLFPKKLESEIFSKVKGHSSLAMLSGQEALPFVGKDIFTFNFSSDLSIVGESAVKPVGDAAITPVAMQPVKVVYQMRVSNEFMYAEEEYQMNVLSVFGEGFAKKLGSGLDKMAMHGVNPATGTSSALINSNNFDAIVTTNTVTYAANSADTNIDSAVALVEASEYDVDGIAMSTTMRGAISALAANGQRKYPEFAFGAVPPALGTMKLDVNATVASNSSKDRAIVGNFEECFRWGIAKQLPLEVIEYGDPDGQGDLKKLNQVLLRSEAFIGWAIMDANAFAIIKTE